MKPAVLLESDVAKSERPQIDQISSCNLGSLPGKSVKYPKRSAPLSAPESSFFKQPATNRRSCGMPTPTLKPLRERIIHLLALKPYRKPELLLWLERERAATKDKAELGAVLDEVKTTNSHHCKRKRFTQLYNISIPPAA